MSNNSIADRLKEIRQRITNWEQALERAAHQMGYQGIEDVPDDEVEELLHLAGTLGDQP